MKTTDGHEFVYNEVYFVQDYNKVVAIIFIEQGGGLITFRAHTGIPCGFAQTVARRGRKIYRDYSGAEDCVKKWIKDNKNEMA